MLVLSYTKCIYSCFVIWLTLTNEFERFLKFQRAETHSNANNADIGSLMNCWDLRPNSSASLCFRATSFANEFTDLAFETCAICSPNARKCLSITKLI